VEAPATLDAAPAPAKVEDPPTQTL
jgi:hypothetical protein